MISEAFSTWTDVVLIETLIEFGVLGVVFVVACVAWLHEARASKRRWNAALKDFWGKK